MTKDKATAVLDCHQLTGAAPASQFTLGRLFWKAGSCTGHAGVSPVKGHRDNEGSGASH